MPCLKPGTIVPSDEEDAAITAAALSDPDALPLTDEEWERVKSRARIGRPPSDRPVKVSTTIRLDADLLAALKATGPGWQTRANDAMRAAFLKDRGEARPPTDPARAGSSTPAAAVGRHPGRASRGR